MHWREIKIKVTKAGLTLLKRTRHGVGNSGGQKWKRLVMVCVWLSWWTSQTIRNLSDIFIYSNLCFKKILFIGECKITTGQS